MAEYHALVTEVLKELLEHTHKKPSMFPHANNPPQKDDLFELTKPELSTGTIRAQTITLANR